MHPTPPPPTAWPKHATASGGRRVAPRAHATARLDLQAARLAAWAPVVGDGHAPTGPNGHGRVAARSGATPGAHGRAARHGHPMRAPAPNGHSAAPNGQATPGTNGHGYSAPNGYPAAPSNGHGNPAPNGYPAAAPNGHAAAAPNGHATRGTNRHGYPAAPSNGHAHLAPNGHAYSAPNGQPSGGPSRRARRAPAAVRASRSSRRRMGLLAGGMASLVTTGLVLGMLWWIGVSMTLQPILAGQRPDWSATNAGAGFPALVGSLLIGGGCGLLLHLLVGRSAGGRQEREPAATAQPTRVVILGGGFGGVGAAKELEQLVGRRPDLDVTIVSKSNYLLFTPMLAEVASRSLEPSHISAPIRAACPRTRFRCARVEDIDPVRQLVLVRAEHATAPEVLAYDHLVIALGAVPNALDLPGVREYAFPLKTLKDANLLRDHVVHLLEQAEVETDPHERRRKLTFVVAGGGFAGTELVASLHDMAHDVLHFFPSITPNELRFTLVHGRERILPELGRELADTALRRLRRQGIEVLLNARVAGATSEDITLADGRILPTRTLVWTAGNRPSPLLDRLPFRRGRGGALVVNGALQVAGHANVWAIGDCAQVPDPNAGGAPCPPTAQHALREGHWVAGNIAAVLAGRQPREFRFKTLGFMVSLGRRTAAAELRGRRFTGLSAWLLWRGVYLSKLPGPGKRLRVLLDWAVDLFYPRDIALTSDQPAARSAGHRVA
jgi:NADH dehydrogenase FAD-containing subunit